MLTLETSAIDGVVHVGLKPQSTTISVDLVPSYYFDRKGRLLGGHTEDRTYRRTFDNRVIAKWSEPLDLDPEVVGAFPRRNLPVQVRRGTIRRRRELPADEAREIISAAHALAAQVKQALVAGDFVVGSPNGERDADIADARTRLGAIAACDYGALAEDARRFNRLYEPIGILPPDQYLALVLQATLGCPWNRCTFCTFYRGRDFGIRGPAQFRRHLQDVLAYHGPALRLFKGLFLADANALVAPQRVLVPLFDIIAETLDIEPPDLGPDERRGWRDRHPQSFDGVHSFVSAPDALRKSPDDFAELRVRGLRRAYIGLESGDEELLCFLHKPNTVKQAIDAVQTIKAGGVAVGVVIMLGIGGDQYADAHVEHTIEAVNAMELGPDDIIYFSEFVDPPDAPYDERARAEGIRPLERSEIWAQEAEMRAGFEFRGRRPTISVYDIREFVY